jgi:hypothetical protein
MKKVWCFLLAVVFMMSLVSVAWADTGFSDEDYAKVEKHVDQANAKIADLVEKADAKADKKNADIDKIIDQLLKQTGHVAQKAIEFGAKYGVVVECEDVEVEIGDQTVIVDPLRIRRY